MSCSRVLFITAIKSQYRDSSPSPSRTNRPIDDFSTGQLSDDGDVLAIAVLWVIFANHEGVEIVVIRIELTTEECVVRRRVRW